MKSFAAALIASTAFAGRYTDIEHPCRIQHNERGPPKILKALEHVEDIPD
jgi:hypothetical protein